MASAIDINVAVEEALVCEIARLKKRVEELEEALTPSVETKLAYIGEFYVRLHEVDEDGNQNLRVVNIPWITIKEIMSAISRRALENK